MQRKKIVAGNWKMNTTYLEATNLVTSIADKLDKNFAVETIIFPPFVFLNTVIESAKNNANLNVGAQNCSEYLNGAYTGEVSATMLQSIRCNYVLIGHSERRHYFKESDEQLILKIKNALQANLKIIFCFGEQLEHRSKNVQMQTVSKQLTDVLIHFSEKDLQNIVLAYEPVWAIGTGLTATPQQAQEMHAHVRTVITHLFSENTAAKISILYGGSCNAQNAKELFSCPDVDGGLIGGASLKADDFCTIINSF